MDPQFTQDLCQTALSLGFVPQNDPLDAPASVVSSLLLYEWILAQEEAKLKAYIAFLIAYVQENNSGTGN